MLISQIYEHPDGARIWGIYKDTYIYIYVYMYIYVCIYICVYIYTYTHVYGSFKAYLLSTPGELKVHETRYAFAK